ncbi:MAG: Chromosomal replication initiator protein DnaA, partial [Microgenomates bacterium OLB22]
NNSIEKAVNKAHLQERYTFEHFAVSNSNHIAHAAAQAVSISPGTHYNPLFIYGGVGVGKTHLMQAIGNHILTNDPTKKVLYVTSEEFTNELIDLIRKKNTSDFRDRFRKVEVLLIDDAQFIAGKNYVQEEFYHTFNTIIKNGGQIVLVSDRHPREIANLEDRLRSRFSGGLIIDMQSPDFELRSAILMIKAKERNISIDIEAAKKIAEKTSDARELEGKLLQIYSRLVITSKDLIITSEHLGSDFEQQETFYRKRVDPQTVIKTVCSYYQIKPHDIRDQTRKSNIAFARQLIMYLLRAHFDFKLDEIAYILKRRDHTTIMHGVEKIRGSLIKDRQLKETVDQILKIL